MVKTSWLLSAAVLLSACNAKVGGGVGVGIPVGDHGHIRVGGGRWH